MSNLGYLRGINGTLTHHILFAHRHIYCSDRVQGQVFQQIMAVIKQEQPDLCCFVEIEQTTFHRGIIRLMADITTEPYLHYDIENKYGHDSRLRTFHMTRGKSNAFFAKKFFHFEKLYFSHGIKRLIYKFDLAPALTLYFAHFSLSKKIRAQQFQEVRQLINNTLGEVIFLGDFNILGGFTELEPLLLNDLVCLSLEKQHTFRFHIFKKTLDICICTRNIAQHCHLQVIPQSYSDHAALLLDIRIDPNN